jgi:hypothetical protein
MIIHSKTNTALAQSIEAEYAYITNLIKKVLLPVRRIYCVSSKVETTRSVKFTLIGLDYINDLLFSTSGSFMFGYVI